MKIERSLSFKRIRNSKKYSFLILSIMILACILLQLVFQLSAGIRETFVEYRKEIYGEWDRIFLEMDEDAEAVISENPFIEKKGKIEIYGVLAGDFLDNDQSNIGTLDQTAWELGHLQMKEGRLPESETEIAMESSMVAALGYEEYLGKEITLEILPSVEFMSEEPVQKQTYTLCGILKDYQVNWEISTRRRLPTGIVTAEGADRIGTALETHMLVKAMAGKESVYKDLEESGIPCSMGENTNKGHFITENIPYENFLKSLRILTIGAAICILFITVSHSISERTDFWRFPHDLGMKKKQMYLMIFWEAFFYSVLSIGIGTTAGILLYRILIPVFEEIIGLEIVYQIFLHSVLSGCIYSILIIIVSYSFSMIRLYQILKKRRKNRKKIKIGKKNRTGLLNFTPFSIALHNFRQAPFRKSIQIILLSIVFFTIGFGTVEIHRKTEELEIFKQSTGNGYYLTVENTPDLLGMPKEMADVLSQIAGVEQVEPYYENHPFESDFTVDMSDYGENRYMQEVLHTEHFFVDTIAMDNIRLHILGIERWEDMQRFINNFSEGSVSEEDFEKGNFCILVLPPLEKMQEGYYMPNLLEEKFQDSFLTEEEIQVGNLLKITRYSENGELLEKEIPITAILRTMPYEDRHTPLPGGSGISIITGSQFWKDFGVDTVDNYYQKIRVLVSDEADVLDTEEHILRLLRKYPAVTLKNWHEEYKQRQQELYTFTGMFSVFIVFYLILVFVVLSQMQAAEAEKKKRETIIFQSLGMETAFLRKIKQKEILLTLGIAIVNGIILLVCCYLFIKKGERLL